MESEGRLSLLLALWSIPSRCPPMKAPPFCMKRGSIQDYQSGWDDSMLAPLWSFSRPGWPRPSPLSIGTWPVTGWRRWRAKPLACCMRRCLGTRKSLMALYIVAFIEYSGSRCPRCACGGLARGQPWLWWCAALWTVLRGLPTGSPWLWRLSYSLPTPITGTLLAPIHKEHLKKGSLLWQGDAQWLAAVVSYEGNGPCIRRSSLLATQHSRACLLLVTRACRPMPL